MRIRGRDSEGCPEDGATFGTFSLQRIHVLASARRQYVSSLMSCETDVANL